MASSVPHPLRRPAEAEPHTEHRPRGEPREQGHPARWADAWTTATHDPKTAATAAYASEQPKPTEARHGTGAAHTEVRASGPDPGRNPSERSPCVRVHCTTDPLANQGAGKPALQANLRCRPPMSSKSVRS